VIKFLARSAPDGGPIIGLGLSDENLTRLRAGQPILVKLRDCATSCRRPTSRS
jgi:hypothetical protein